MMFLSLLTLASLPAFSLAARTVTACVQTCGDLTTSCSTKYATDSVAVVSTVTTTNTVPTTVTIVATETTFVLTTVTPTPITTTTTTTTTTVTTTTLSDVSSTITVTETDTETDTATTTTTSTETDTETVSTTTTSTSEVPTPSGFRPVQDTTNGYPSSKKAKRGHSEQQGWGLSNGNASMSSGSLFGMWPNQVNCEVVSVVSETRVLYSTVALNSTTTVTQISTSVEADPTYTTLPAVDVTVTITATATSTSTKGPATDLETATVSTTITTTTTTTATATATTSTTTTMTYTSTASTYGACATNNMIGPVYTSGGETRTIVNFFNNGGGSVTSYNVVSAASSYDCCVACVNSDDCTSSLFQPGLCLLIEYGTQGTGQCVQSQNPDFWTYTVGSDPSDGYTISNGLCGYAYDGGIEQ